MDVIETDWKNSQYLKSFGADFEYLLHTAEYATIFLAFEWLYFLRHGINVLYFTAGCELLCDGQ